MPLKNLKEPINYEEIYESAHSLGIYEILEKKAGLLSVGEQQRVAILRALATKRPIILADEPTGSLDFEYKSIVMKLLSKINKNFNRTIIMVTHNNQLDSYFTHTFTIKEKVIVFGFSLFDEDTKAYFLKQDDNLILGEVNNTPDCQKDLDIKIDTLNKNGILVQHDETIFTTSGYVKSNYISEYVSIHVAETFMYTENQIVGTIDRLFQKPLEGGVYISEEVYRKLESPIQIDVEINKAIFKLPINGVYNIKRRYYANTL